MLFPKAMSALPTISVIVVCRNPGRRLSEALGSVWDQSGADAELVVIDGASTDGTRAWLEDRRARLAALVSEPDHGVYDAMNKGVAVARGSWILFLGADDRVAAPSVLAEARVYLERSAAGVVGGEAVYEDGRCYRFHAPLRPAARNFIHHQAAFYRRSLFSAHGGFDAALGIMADYDFNLRLWRQGVSFASLPLRIAICGVGGLSDHGHWRNYREEIAVRHRHFGGLRSAGWDVITVARFLRKQLVRRRRLAAPDSSHG